ncbi:MAG: 4-hydroxy-tetrahydrodipicolinate reductase [Clostridiaceae bacterium]|jgi:4-hydroxy-tetrahydrodipicolinate reductase|nr:4-hydroxy-tetrahydrodipicolinate reductase [Clostridiaceae bacterium]
MNILLAGATGKMGRMLIDRLKDSEHCIVAGYAAEEDPTSSFPVYLDIDDCEETEQIDVIIDFSSPRAFGDLVFFALRNKIPIVIATTGFSEDQEKKIAAAADHIPVFHSKNMSLGVNIMQVVVEQLAAKLGDFDIEIIEKHHRYKADSPSGTAKMLFESVNKGRKRSLKALEGRSGFYPGRSHEEVGISAIRGGTIVGEHTVLFAGEDEIIEVKHTANSRAVFANGAIKAAEFLIKQGVGLYDMNDVLR